MKKITFALLLLLVFGSTAFADYKFYYPEEVTLTTAIGDNKSISLGGTANITAFACSLKTENKATYQDMLIGSTNGGSDLYKGNPGDGKSTSFIYHSKSVNCSTSAIHFKHPVLCAKRTCKDMIFTIATSNPSIADVALSSTTTCTFNVFSGTEISTSNFTSTDENFAVTNVSLVKDYCYSVTISFTPTSLGLHSSTIKLNGEDAATVSANGLPNPTTALDATDVTHTSFTANWEASEFEGAKYDIEVKDDEYTTIAYVTVIGSTFYTITGLDPESTYSYVVYVSVDDVTSDASNVIEVATLAKPAITPDQYEYTLISDTGIEGYTSIIITAVNVTEATATVTGDAEFYFKDVDGNPVTTKTFAVEPEGPTEIELYSMFTEGGDFSATVTFSATDADDVTVSVTATATFVVPATTALAATNITHNSFTANWVASNLEGATYSIEVRNEDYDLIASASGLEETSYAVSNLDPESSYSYVVFVSVGEDTSYSSNSIAVKTLKKPVITPNQDEYQLLSDTSIEDYTSIIITAVNVTEATATITGDAEFYFKDADGNPVTTKTFAVEPEGPTEVELFSYFTADGDYSATITFSATDADDAVVTVLANVSKPTNAPEQKLSSIVKSFNNGLLELDKDYASIIVSNLAGKTVAEGKGHTIAVEQGQILMIEIIDFEGNKSTVKVK